MLSELRARKRAYERALRERVESADRYIDIGVILHTVAADDAGAELLEGKPRLRVIRTQPFGGIVDTRADRPTLVGPSRRPVKWFVSEDQEAVVLHRDCDPLGQLVYGSEGAGKSTALAQWHYFRWLEHLGERKEGGQLAPIRKRLKFVRDELFALWPGSWFTYLRAEDLLVLCDGSRIQFRATKQQSAETGCPIQGYTWAWAGRDEGQDMIERHAAITMRGRGARKAPDGSARYKQLVTATAKDSPDWRTFRDALETARTKAGARLWLRRTLLGVRSPFVAAEFWEQAKATMSPREYRRRVLAEDVPPERALYPYWERGRNLRPRPQLGAIDVTARELAAWGPHHHVLVGHDPGQLFDVSLLLKAYKLPGIPDPVWWVVDEVTTEQTTTAHHVRKLLVRLRSHWGCNRLDERGRPEEDGPTALVRADPYGDTETENDHEHPDETVYTVFRQHGIAIRAAAYAASTARVKVGRVPREGRIDLVNGLFYAESGVSRLFVDCDDRRAPVAPRLVKSLESSERDPAGRAERNRKDVNDPTHWPAALGYALWAVEKPRMSLLTPAGSSRSVL